MDQPDKPEGQRFICYVALSEAGALSGKELCAAVAAEFPGTIEMLGQPEPRGAASGLGQASLIGFGNILLAVMFVDSPLPRDAWERAVELDRVWPRAREAMERHKAHVIVSNVSPTTNHGEALMAATAVTLAAAALTKLIKTEAVIWAAAETIAAPDRFAEAARGFEQKQIPADIWMGMTWLDGPQTPKGERTLAVLTSGLLPFAGREIEFMPAALPPVTMAQRLLGTAQYLVVSGPVLKDGDTLGVSETERIRVRFADRGPRPGVPIYQLSMEQLDESPLPVNRVGGLPSKTPKSHTSQRPAFGKRTN